MLSFVLVMLLGIGSAHAGASLEPQNRVHAGLSVVDGPAPVGVVAGFDSRLSRLIAMDIGGWVSPAQIPIGAALEDADYQTYFEVRHGVYIMPGLRIPHAQPKAFAFDLLVRAGGGAVWVANTEPGRTGFEHTNYLVSTAPAGILGGDAIVRLGSVGLRVSGKAIAFSATRDTQEESFFLVRSQWGFEGFVQW